MITADELRDLAKNTVTDIDYVMVVIQSRITEAAVEGDSKCWVRFNTRYLKNKSDLEGVANDVVRTLTENGFEAEFETFADAEYEEYLRFKISWRR